MRNTGDIPMRANQAFPSKYLKSSDMKEKPRIAVITHLAQETVGQGQDAKEKHVLYFVDQKPLVLNRTNWDTLEAASGGPLLGDRNERYRRLRRVRPHAVAASKQRRSRQPMGGRARG